MSGDRFNFDETGDTFCCFAIAIFTVILLPATYFLWPKYESKLPSDVIKKRCQCAACQAKRANLRSGSKTKLLKRSGIKFAIIVAWAILIALCFKLSQFEVTTPSFDPFAELEIDQQATKLEIKKAYKKLSLIHHPDRGGDEQKFIRIHKAYITLTDEVAHRNWQEYGNSDGPGAINFGMALPKWMIKKENTVIVVGVYALIFLLMLPIVVGWWWSNSKKFSNTQVLLVTIRLYCGSFLYNPFMAVHRIIKLLSSSYEFNSQFNKDIACRPSDNIELPPVNSHTLGRVKTKLVCLRQLLYLMKIISSGVDF
ncbi:unnamed protein product [Hymenolepis diminuta]|uniref:J domain-containing protein n=1 Tax=Hymenolepis diminuta TaxID=6216 RepID=A0A564Z7D5_HYMDI|nr:unnamed protein product [Hymenolepis diminuta]